MVGSNDSQGSNCGLSEEQKSFEDAEYGAWVDAQIRQGREDLKDPAKRHSEKEVWKALGLKD